MSRFIPVDRQSAYLLPPSLEDWLPEDHLARFILEAIEQLDLGKLSGAYAGRGSAAYHPEVLLSLLVYGYATGVFSSRRIERATHDSVAFRFLAANSHPDHDTLATFRRRFLSELSDIFLQVLELAGEMKLLKLGSISLDGYRRCKPTRRATVRCRMATSTNSRAGCRAKCRSCSRWPSRPTGPIFPTA